MSEARASEDPRAGSSAGTEPGVVTVAVPLYRRFRYVPGVLDSVAAQDHPRVDLLVSDNGENGREVRELVDEHAPTGYRFRRNDRTVGIVDHFNQLVEAARGEYFVLLQDDDQIGPSFLSTLVGVLEAEPDVGAALGRVEVMDEEGRTVDRDAGAEPPRRMTGREFVRLWCRGDRDFVCFATNVARTGEIRAAGGYPSFPKGTGVDNALLVKLVLGRRIAWEPDAVFRYRVYEESHGLSLPPAELARDLADFLDFLDRDPDLEEYAREHPEAWSEVRARLERMTWGTYRHRWKNMYRDRLSRAEWVRAAFEMPWIPDYYAAVLRHMARRFLSASKRRLLGTVRSMTKP